MLPDRHEYTASQLTELVFIYHRFIVNTPNSEAGEVSEARLHPRRVPWSLNSQLMGPELSSGQGTSPEHNPPAAGGGPYPADSVYGESRRNPRRSRRGWIRHDTLTTAGIRHSV